MRSEQRRVRKPRGSRSSEPGEGVQGWAQGLATWADGRGAAHWPDQVQTKGVGTHTHTRAHRGQFGGYPHITNGQKLQFVRNQGNACRHCDTQMPPRQPGRHWKGRQTPELLRTPATELLVGPCSGPGPLSATQHLSPSVPPQSPDSVLLARGSSPGAQPSHGPCTCFF